MGEEGIIKSRYGVWKDRDMLFPELDQTIFIDIETDLDMSKVWLIGVKVGPLEVQFLAQNWDEEAVIMKQFSDFLDQHPALPLVCYSTTNFDFRVMLAAAKRLGYKKLIQSMLSRALIDMGTLLRRHFRPHGGSYSLKLIRFLIGYDYDDITLSGEEVAIQYYKEVKYRGKVSESFAEKALKYNLDDVRILSDIIEKFEPQITFTTAFSGQSNVSEVKHQLDEYLYSYTVNNRYIRISVKEDTDPHFLGRLMSLGAPLPQVRKGKSVTAYYWKGKFSYSCMCKLIGDLGLSE